MKPTATAPTCEFPVAVPASLMALTAVPLPPLGSNSAIVPSGVRTNPCHCDPSKSWPAVVWLAFTQRTVSPSANLVTWPFGFLKKTEGKTLFEVHLASSGDPALVGDRNRDRVAGGVQSLKFRDLAIGRRE